MPIVYIAAALLWGSSGVVASPATRPGVSSPQGTQACDCPVLECPVKSTAAFNALSLDDQALCDEKDWALRQIGWYRMKEKMPFTGQGIVVADIDTGYTEHPALPIAQTATSPGILEDETFNYAEGCPDMASCAPRDPEALGSALDPMPFGWPIFRQPGHGTGPPGVVITPGVTVHGSVSCSPPPHDPTADRTLQGVAPGAQLIPIRVSNGVILSEGRSARVAKAIVGAALSAQDPMAKAAVDVISISFGRRSPDEELESAVNLAEQHGVIVVAATGEYPFFSPVRFPAQYPTVIGATGTRVNGRPWGGVLGAGRGPTAFIAAPAYKVWRPSTKKASGKQCYTANMGKGTSFSAPLVAASAALWLERWTKPHLRSKYGVATVPAVFRYVLWTSGHRNPGELCDLAHDEGWPNAGRGDGGDGVCPHRKETWDRENWGRGILAVDKLLAEPLPSPEMVCEWVYRRSGEYAWDRACPVGSPGRDDNLPKQKPAPMHVEHLTRLAGATFGRPFGTDGGAGPALDYGIIFSEHHYHAPRGLLLQVQGGAPTNVGLSAGYGMGIGYDPFRDSKESVSAMPGFGPAVGFAVKATYLSVHREGRPRANRVGPQIQIAAFKIKLGTGLVRDVGGERRWHWTWEGGFGF
jgi:hypothetical protein